MAREIQPGVPAKYKYNPVRYSHVPIRPGQSAVLTADPWSYLHGYLLQTGSKKRGDNRRNLERANYYARLAEDFYRAGELVDLPTQGTLLYYGMLNLVKCLLSADGVPLESQIEHHGLNLAPEMKFELNIPGASKQSVNIFAEFARVLGTPVAGKHHAKLQDAVAHVTELHAICSNLGFIRRPKFLPVDINFLTNAEHTYLFTEVGFSKGHEQTLPTKKFLSGERKAYFIECPDRDGKAVYRSKSRKRLRKNWKAVYGNVLKEYSKFRFTSVLTRNGYRYYCDLEPGDYHHLCYALMVMFYIGSAARYRPSEVEEVLNGPLRPLVTEAVALCPRQFLYQLVSLITGQLCVIPYAQI